MIENKKELLEALEKEYRVSGNAVALARISSERYLPRRQDNAACVQKARNGGLRMNPKINLERGKRLTKVYTATGFGEFSRKRINEILEIVDLSGVKVSGSQPFLIHNRGRETGEGL